MSSVRPTCGKRLAIAAALAAFVLMAVGSGCRGFFINQPNSITVTQGGSSTLAVAVGTPQQLTATASYNNGTKIVTNEASWSSSTACATVDQTGRVTANGPASSVTITATLAGVQGTITGSTTGGTAQTLTISPTTVTLSSGTTQFQAIDSNNVNQAANATWTSSNTSVLSFASSTGGLATLSNTGTATVTASTTSSGGTCASGSVSVTVQ